MRDKALLYITQFFVSPGRSREFADYNTDLDNARGRKIIEGCSSIPSGAIVTTFGTEFDPLLVCLGPQVSR